MMMSFLSGRCSGAGHPPSSMMSMSCDRKSHRRAGSRRDEAKIPRRRPPRSSKLSSKVSSVRRDAKSDRRNPAKSRDPPIEVSLITARLLCVDFFLRRCSSLSPRVLYLYPGGRSHSVFLLYRCSRKSPSASGFGAEVFLCRLFLLFSLSRWLWGVFAHSFKYVQHFVSLSSQIVHRFLNVTRK